MGLSLSRKNMEENCSSDTAGCRRNFPCMANIRFLSLLFTLLEAAQHSHMSPLSCLAGIPTILYKENLRRVVT